MSRTLWIQTLSPLHIGTNVLLQPFEYVVEGGKFFRLALDSILEKILLSHPEAADHFDRWIEEKSRQLSRERDNRRIAQLRREFTLVSFVRTRLRDDRLARAIQDGIADGTLTHYQLDCPSLEGLKREPHSQRSTQQSKTTVAAALKTATGELYIPGSSLKGVFRTAMLHQVLTEADATFIQTIASALDQKLRQYRQQQHHISDRVRKSFDEVLESEVFFCGVVERGRTIWNDGKFDLFKLIHVSDSTTLSPAQWGIVLPIDVYQANGAVQPQTPAAEAIAAGSVVECCISVDTAFIKSATEFLRQGKAGFGQTQWIGLEEKFERLYGCSLAQATEERLIERILEAVAAFGRAVANHDRAWAEQHQSNADGATVSEFYEQLPEIPCPLGYGSGFHGTTVMLAMHANPELATLEGEIIRLFGIGTSPTGRRTSSIALDRFPSSRRMATRWSATASYLEPLGWIQLSLSQLAPVSKRASAAHISENPEETQSVATEPPIAATLRHGAIVCARVIDNRTQPLLVELYAKGHEGRKYQCTGIRNISDLVPGTIIQVQVNLHPTTRQVQSLRFVGRWQR